MKKYISCYLLFLLVGSISPSLFAQTFTMGKECAASIQKATSELKEKKYDLALQTVGGMTKCNTKDAKLAKEEAKAEALNGLGKHEEALGAANYALKMSKDLSLNGWFQRAVAENKMGDVAASKNSLGKMMSLTTKNVNVKERASNFALMGALYDRQLGETDSAHYFIDKAIELDPTNYRYVLEKGDMYARKKQYSEAFETYDKVAALGKKRLRIISNHMRLKNPYAAGKTRHREYTGAPKETHTGGKIRSLS